MSLLRIYSESDPSRFKEILDSERIAGILAPFQIKFDRWIADRELAANATQEEILAAYAGAVQKLMQERGFVTADVISVNPDTPNHPDLRKKFLDEHTHKEDEARFFVEGSGVFYIHVNAQVFVVLCEKGDFIDLPPRTKHWFDFGPKPHVKAIRTFVTPEGWVADYTGSDIASHFPRYEAIVAVPV
jgi:1,2-dihydroxy-3-keto-5-methylthiopentene dioxygenase